MEVPPETSKKVVFVLSWYFPNRPCTAPRETLPKDIWGNQYSTWFADAKDVACQFSASSSDLIAKTRLFVETLYQSSIPWEVLESAAGRMACLRSPTMFWTADGRVLGNEGNDCCPLNCSHVYGYTTLMERLFPGMTTSAIVSGEGIMNNTLTIFSFSLSSYQNLQRICEHLISFEISSKDKEFRCGTVLEDSP